MVRAARTDEDRQLGPHFPLGVLWSWPGPRSGPGLTARQGLLFKRCVVLHVVGPGDRTLKVCTVIPFWGLPRKLAGVFSQHWHLQHHRVRWGAQSGPSLVHCGLHLLRSPLPPGLTQGWTLFMSPGAWSGVFLRTDWVSRTQRGLPDTVLPSLRREV